MNTPEHRDLRESLGAYALGGLSAGEVTAVETHLGGCADCRADLADITPAAHALASIDPTRMRDPQEPPAELLDRIVDRVVDRRVDRVVYGEGDASAPPSINGAVASRSAPRGSAPRRGNPGRRYVLVGAAFVVTAVAAGALGYVTGARTGPPSTPIAVTAVAPGIDASARMIAHTWGTEIVLTADGLRHDGVYRVVVRDRSGAALEAGAFRGTGAQEMVCNLNSAVPPADATGFEVLDPSGAVVINGRV